MLPVHDLCAIFPDIDGKEFEELVEDIKDNGQLEKIETYEGLVIDGKNRQRACVSAGVTPEYSEWSPPDGVSDGEVVLALRQHIKSRNLKRRHLSATERAFLGAKLRKLEGMTIGAAASELKVSPRLVTFASDVLNNGDSSLIEAVEKNEITVSDAARIVDLPKPTQRAAVNSFRSGESKNVNEAAGRKRKKIEPKFEDGADLDILKETVAATDIDEKVDQVEVDLKISTGDTFSATSQSSWRSAFSVFVRLNDQWRAMPKQVATKMKSERIHNEFNALLHAVHKKWSEMNQGGRWS